MGTKFANLQVYHTDCSLIGQLCPDCTVKSVSPGWTTIVGDHIQWGSAQKEAKHISTVIPYPVLSTECFDGDYVEFAVYQDGKLLGKHIPASYEGFSVCVGDPKVFQTAFNLSNDAGKQLRTVFQETNPEISLRLLSSILGCVLWVDQVSVGEVKLPSAEFLKGYLEKKAQLKKFKNKTRLTLSDELAGDFWNSVTLPVVKYEDPSGGNKSIWTVSPEGRFRHCYNTDLPGRLDKARAHGCTQNYHLFHFLYWDKSRNPVYETHLFFADGSRHHVLSQGNLPRLLEGTFLNGEQLFCDGICYDVTSGKVSLDMGIGQTYYGIRCPVETWEGNYIFTYDIEHGQLESYLACFDMNGTVRKTIRLPDHRHWAYPILYKDFVYFLYAAESNQSVIVCYDCALNELWRERIPGTAQLQQPFLDKKFGIVYFASSYNTLVAFSLYNRKLVSVKNISEAEVALIAGVLPGTGPILLTGDTSIEVWNDSFELLSKHRTKGSIVRIFQIKNSTYILTHREGSHGDDSVVRVYRLVSI